MVSHIRRDPLLQDGLEGEDEGNCKVAWGAVGATAIRLKKASSG